MKELIIVTVSGGRTSGYMAYWLKKNMSWLYDFKFIYANTGQEHPKTLDFIHKIDKHFNLNLVWLEAIVHHNKRKSSTYTIVDYNSADRTGKVFEQVIIKYGLPKLGYMHCTRELKINVMNSWKKANGYGNCRTALGIRYDEFRRVTNQPDIIYPLATITKTTKQEVLDFWKTQPFDLEISEEQGNCQFCYKKSDKKLAKLATETPEVFDFIKAMEFKYPEPGYYIFRNNKSVDDVLNMKYDDTLSTEENCAEECGTVLPK